MLSPDDGCVGYGHCTAHHGSEVLRILDLIESDGDQIWIAEQFGKRDKFKRRRPTDDPLVLDTAGNPVHVNAVGSIHVDNALIERESSQRFEFRGVARLNDDAS